MKQTDRLKLCGLWITEHFRAGKLINRIIIRNLIVNVAKNDIMNVYFRGAAQNIHWYMGLMNNAGFAAVAAADTMASHAGWTEFTGYDEANRPEWVTAAAAGQSISNPSPIVMTINTGATLKGLFLSSSSTKAGTTGTLWSGAAYATPVVVSAADILRNTYTLSC
jgi:hypothetical protein